MAFDPEDDSQDNGIINPQLFKFRNAFDFQPQPNIPMAEPMQPGLSGMFGGPVPQQMPHPAIVDAFQPQYNRMNAFNQVADLMPLRTEPSTRTKIHAGIASLAAIDHPEIQQQIKNQILDAPYNEQMADWKARLGPLYQGAQLEQKANIDERVLADERERRRLEQERNDTGKKNAETAANKAAETERANKAKEEDRKARTAIQEYRNQNRNKKLMMDDEGYVMAVNPDNNSMEYVLDNEGEKIHSSKLTDAQKIGMQHTNTMSAIAARGDQAVREENVKAGNRENLEGTKQGNRATNIEARGEKAKEVKATPSGSVRTSIPREQNESQKAKAVVNKAQEIKATRADLAPYITIKPGNVVEINQPSSWGGAAKKAKAQEAADLIFGKGSTQNTSAVKPADNELMHGIDPATGEVRQIRKSQADAAVAQGWKVW